MLKCQEKWMRVGTAFVLLGLCALNVLSQTPPPPAKTQAPKTQPAGPPSPQSFHHPVLLLAFGNDPNWSLRVGQKGPERLDRPGYPPIPLEPAEVINEAADSWTYRAKDSATGAAVVIHLTRQPCTEAKNDTLTTSSPPSGKYAFRASVEHAQLASMRGCARIAAELFPRINNQPDQDDDDEKKKPPPPTITNFKAPVSVAYVNANGAVVLSRGKMKKIVAPEGSELALSHDGKKLLYTRSDSKTGPERSIVLYDFDSGKSTDLVHGDVRQAFWSPDDSRIAYIRAQDRDWQVWTFAAGSPESTSLFSPQPVTGLHGWIDTHTTLATDSLNAYWLSDATLPQAVALREIYGPLFQIMSSDTLRVSPINSDLLLVSAYYASAPKGAPVDNMGLTASLFLYELKSKRRSTLCPPDQWGKAAEWSRDSLQIFFTGMDSTRHSSVTNRVFWDGTSLTRMLPASNYVIGQ